jgi:hypothetical protein
MFEEGARLAEKYGADKVYDYSLGILMQNLQQRLFHR